VWTENNTRTLGLCTRSNFLIFRVQFSKFYTSYCACCLLMYVSGATLGYTILINYIIYVYSAKEGLC